MLVDTLSPRETRELVKHFIGDDPVTTIPGPGKHELRLVRGFVTEDEGNELSLSMSETTFTSTSWFRNSRFGQWLLGALPRVSYSVLIEDLTDPAQSRNILSMGEGLVNTVFMDKTLEQTVRQPSPDDIAFVNQALTKALPGRENDEA
jgi:hypothetical protein